MKLRVKRLSPVTDSEVELGDVTLFLGPPNTGKSYTLRAIYAELFPLDDYALRFVKRKLSRRLTGYLERLFIEQALNRSRDLVKAIVKIFLAITLLQTRDETSGSFGDILRRIGVKGAIERREDFFIISIKDPLIDTNIDANVLKQATHESLHEFIAELVPMEDVDSITFEPADLLRIDISLDESLEHKSFIDTR